MVHVQAARPVSSEQGGFRNYRWPPFPTDNGTEFGAGLIFICARRIDEKGNFSPVRGFEHGDAWDEHIGDGVRAIKVRQEDLEQIVRQNPQHVDTWTLSHGGLSHAIINRYESDAKSDDEAEQEIVRAFLALRIIKPTSLALHTIVKAVEDQGESIYTLENRIGMYSLTYISEKELNARIERVDVQRARRLWPNIQRVFQNWRAHERIVRAARFFEIAFANYNGEVRHILFHTALECLLCTHPGYLGQQIRARVRAIHPEIEQGDLRDIGRLRGGFVHSGAIISPLRGRADELMEGLERVVRGCLYHVLADCESVEVFSDENEIRRRYPVEVDEMESEPTGRKISI